MGRSRKGKRAVIVLVQLWFRGPSNPITADRQRKQSTKNGCSIMPESFRFRSLSVKCPYVRTVQEWRQRLEFLRLTRATLFRLPICSTKRHAPLGQSAGRSRSSRNYGDGWIQEQRLLPGGPIRSVPQNAEDNYPACSSSRLMMGRRLPLP